MDREQFNDESRGCDFCHDLDRYQRADVRDTVPHKPDTDPHKQVRSFVDLMLGCRVLGLI